jgi:hypothetical protein
MPDHDIGKKILGKDLEVPKNTNLISLKNKRYSGIVKIEK